MILRHREMRLLPSGQQGGDTSGIEVTRKDSDVGQLMRPWPRLFVPKPWILLATFAFFLHVHPAVVVAR